MPRTKTFSIDGALDKATGLFLKRGYATLSMRELAEALGLSRSSIYSTFNSKRRLFVTVLKRYGPSRPPGLSELRASPAPRAALAEMFELAAAGVGGERSRCLVLNTIMEMSGADPEIGRLVEDAVEDLERCFREAIERGQAAGEIANGAQPAQTARVLVSLYLGVYVLVRSGVARKPALRSVVAQVQTLLPAPASAEHE